MQEEPTPSTPELSDLRSALHVGYVSDLVGHIEERGSDNNIPYENLREYSRMVIDCAVYLKVVEDLAEERCDQAIRGQAQWSPTPEWYEEKIADCREMYAEDLQSKSPTMAWDDATVKLLIRQVCVDQELRARDGETDRYMINRLPLLPYRKPTREIEF